MKNTAKFHAWAELAHPLLHKRHQEIWMLCRISPAPLQLLALKIFWIFNLKVGGFKVWSLGQSGQFFLWMTKKHSWNKGESPPDKLPHMGLVRASLLAGYYPDFIFFQHRHNSAFFPDPDY